MVKKIMRDPLFLSLMAVSKNKRKSPKINDSGLEIIERMENRNKHLCIQIVEKLKNIGA